MEWYYYLLFILSICITSPITVVILYFILKLIKFIFYTMPVESFKLIYGFSKIKDEKTIKKLLTFDE